MKAPSFRTQPPKEGRLEFRTLSIPTIHLQVTRQKTAPLPDPRHAVSMFCLHINNLLLAFKKNVIKS